MNMFDEIYASAYDAIYQDKEYGAECDLLEELFEKYATPAVERVLDFGCGTGNHAIELAARGYKVVGVDRSGFMLEKARRKSKYLDPQFPKPKFHKGDICRITLPDTFDAVLLMFSVLGYQIRNGNVLRALRNVRRHLRVGGILVFDVWYGPAVLAQHPGDRLRIIRNEQGTFLRAASGEMDSYRQTCTVKFHLWEIHDHKLVAETEESHVVRFFFPQELELFLAMTGFKLHRLGAFPEITRDPNLGTWNVMVLAEAVSSEEGPEQAVLFYNNAKRLSKIR